ncbi:MAG: DUF2442 domain-containing protein [bacterium]|nr:DUF2442 domain-containing protein [bacterium]
MNPRVIAVMPISRYRLRITFANGEIGTYDCSPLLEFGVFRELRDESYFRQARVEGGTVVWPHEQDICPDTLYLDSAKTQKRTPSKRSKRTASHACRR